MTTTIDQGIDALRKLSPVRQAELADHIYHLAADDCEPEDIDPAHLRAVLERATPEQVEAALSHDGTSLRFLALR